MMANYISALVDFAENVKVFQIESEQWLTGTLISHFQVLLRPSVYFGFYLCHC